MKEQWVVFGGAGYLGNILCRTLLNKGYKVRCVDNFHKGHADSLLSIINHPDFTFIRGDVCIPDDCLSNIQDANFIVNLAGIVGFPACKEQPILSKAVNVDGAKNVVEARDKISEYIPLFYASTGSVYSVSPNELCTEESYCAPPSLYGQHKLQGERIVLQHRNTLAYRYATAFGVSPSMRVNLLVNDLVSEAITKKTINIFQSNFKRTFIHIQDVCDAIIYGLTHIGEAKFNLYNCGDDNLNWSKRQLAEYIQKKTGCYVTYNEAGSDADVRNYAVSYQRLNDFGFKCKVGMEQGIDEIIKSVSVLRMRNPYE